MSSYSLQDFVGDGVLKDILDALVADGWDDVPTLKMMSASDMDAIGLTPPQRDALEIRTYLHDRSLMQYADKLEGCRLGLPELLNTNPAVLSSEYGMRRGHVARFVDRATACGIVLPPNLTLPARKRTVVSRDGGESDYGGSQQTRTTPERSPPASLASSATGAGHRRRVSADQLSVSSQPGLDTKSESGLNEKAKKGDTRIKGIVAAVPPNPRLCGLVKPAPLVDDVTPLAVLEKIYVQKLTSEHKIGVDPWANGELKVPPPSKVAELWSSKPTLIFCIRRPGCVMCRAEAHQLYARKPIFDALGIQLVAVLNECIDSEVKLFWPRYWGGLIVLDKNRDFFKALGGGKLPKDDLITGFFFNSQAWQNWKRAKATGFDLTYTGEGHIKGGLYIVGAGQSGVAYQFVERTFGDWAPLEEVLDVCTKLQSN